MRAARLALKNHVILERESEEDDVVLIDSQSGRMSACNETATVLVAALAEGTSFAALVKKITAAYEVSDEDATRDVNALLDQLAADGLLEAAG